MRPVPEEVKYQFMMVLDEEFYEVTRERARRALVFWPRTIKSDARVPARRPSRQPGFAAKVPQPARRPGTMGLAQEQLTALPSQPNLLPSVLPSRPDILAEEER